MQPSPKSTLGFTLVEIMVVVSIIAVLGAISIPNFLRARKRSQAARILQDLRIVDAAINQYAIEFGKASGDTVQWTGIQLYIKNGTVPWFSNGNDLFGNPYTQGNGFTVDGLPKLNAASYQMLSDVAPVAFWSPYYP
jgi:prepilin-type N-terminal cleavage/methylation domain-containing protein